MYKLISNGEHYFYGGFKSKQNQIIKNTVSTLKTGLSRSQYSDLLDSKEELLLQDVTFFKLMSF